MNKHEDGNKIKMSISFKAYIIDDNNDKDGYESGNEDMMLIIRKFKSFLKKNKKGYY